MALANKMHELSFKEVVEVTSKHELVPITIQLKEDVELIELAREKIINSDISGLKNLIPRTSTYI